MSAAAEQEMEAIKAILEKLQPFGSGGRKRIMGYVQHYLRSLPKQSATLRDEKG